MVHMHIFAFFQLIEMIFKVFPENGPQIFEQMLPGCFKALTDEDVS